MKNPFKKKSITDTLTNVGIGGAANAAIDYVWEQVSALADYDQYKHLIKVVGGVLAGTMISNKYARAAADGVATVGVSNLVADRIEESGSKDNAGNSTTGLPQGTIGYASRRRAGSAAYARASRRSSSRMAGLNDFMSE